ncbi:hypothetical protein ACTFIW_000018 [Dictyostelium discoideum]
MDLLVKLGFKLNIEKRVLEPTLSISFLRLQIDSVSMKLLIPKEKKKIVIKEIRNFLKLDCCSPRKLAGLKGKLTALKDAVIPFRLYTRRKNKFHSHLVPDTTVPIPKAVKSEMKYKQQKIDFNTPADNQELQLAIEEGSVQSNPTSVRISPEPSNVQLLNNQNE